MWAGNNLMLFVPFVSGFAWLVRSALGREQGQRASLLLPALLAAQPVASAISTNFHRAPWFQSQRYFANLGPLYLVVGTVGAWRLWQQRRQGRGRVAPIGALALLLAASLARQPDQARLYARNVKNITELQVQMARWLRDRAPQGALLALNDVGAVAVITESPVLDLMGLVSPETLACRTVENVRTNRLRECLRQVMDTLQPDYMAVISRPEHVAMYDRSAHLRPAVYRREINDNITAGGSVAVVYPTIWCRYPASATAPASAGP